MKTKFVLILMLSFSFCILSAQVPQGFNYQAIARDGTGAVLANQSLTVRMTIQTTLAGGIKIWEETFSVTTNQFGAMVFVIGTGTRTGGSAALFSDINWASQAYFLKTEVNPGSGYVVMGTTQLWTVPYSMIAKDLVGPVGKLGVKGTTDNMEEALFEVKNKTGQTIFAVYNEGVRIYVSDGDAKGAKGGFAIGGFDMTKGVGEYLRVSKDSVRIYLNDTGVKGSKGGFAIGGYDLTKNVKHDYLKVSRDSVRIYFNNNQGKGAKGGFSIGGFDLTKGNIYPENLLTVSDDSIRMYIKSTAKAAKGGFAIGGYGTGKAGPDPQFLSVRSNMTNIQSTDSLKGFSVTNVQGTNKSDFININKINYSIGHESGLKTNPNISLLKGKYNVFFGYKAGFNNIEGYGNIFLGHESGYATTIGSYNVYMGFRSGNLNVNGNSNVYVGYQSGEKSSASYNTYLGQGAGKENSIGTQNTYIGTQAGIDDGKFYISDGITPGSSNTFVGFRAGASSFGGSNNVYIGCRAGELNNNYRSGRVFIGYYAGYNDGNDNRLYIDNSSSTTPLIYGEFNATMTSRQLTINGKVTTNGSFNYGAATGASNAYTVTIQGVTAYVAGMMITFQANAPNTAACTVNVNSLGAKSLKMKHDLDPVANFIETGSMVVAVYDGTNFQMIQPSAL